MTIPPYSPQNSDDSSVWTSTAAPKVRLFCNRFEQLSSQRCHEVYLYGLWDVPEMLRQHSMELVHSSSSMRQQSDEAIINRFFFNVSDDVFVFGDLDFAGEGFLSFWAATPELAHLECVEWRGKFLKKPKRKREPAFFRILSITRDGVETKPIPIVTRFPRTNADLSLHYGQNFVAWERQFMRHLRSHVSGASILQGDPGTGKTTFIRHLIHKLRRTHRFYYLPANQLAMLSAPQLVQFWIRESHLAEKKIKVIVIEDAEPLLITRGHDNHDQLSNFLNITDGLPGEFLKLHLICTVNCKIDKLDPAVTRTGRLVAYRRFCRLNPLEAERLAIAKGLTIPKQDSYSLAEIYDEQRSGFDECRPKRVGFG